MLAFLGNLTAVAVIVMYGYVAVAAVRAELRSDAGIMTALTKGVMWPVTIWHTIDKLYLTKPEI